MPDAQETIETLVAARHLISTPERWTQRYVARDVRDEFASPESAEACKFCAFGAITRVFGYACGSPAADALNAAAVRRGFQADEHNELDPVEVFNDAEETTHADVLALFDEAIEALR